VHDSPDINTISPIEMSPSNFKNLLYALQFSIALFRTYVALLSTPSRLQAMGFILAALGGKKIAVSPVNVNRTTFSLILTQTERHEGVIVVLRISESLYSTGPFSAFSMVSSEFVDDSTVVSVLLTKVSGCKQQ
jgi:hypothetical protein